MKKRLITLIVIAALGAAMTMTFSGCSNTTDNSGGGESALTDSSGEISENNSNSDNSENSESSSEDSLTNNNSENSSDSDENNNDDSGDVSADEQSEDNSDNSDNSNNVISAIRSQIVQTASAMVGIDFASGEATPERGFDNSGFIYYVLRENGFINCPRGTSSQMAMGTCIELSDILEGDLVFFSDKDDETGKEIYFGGIYIGDGNMIYSPYPGEKVKTVDITSPYWSDAFYCAVSVG